jgi:AraC-like DNA-binding protein
MRPACLHNLSSRPNLGIIGTSVKTGFLLRIPKITMTDLHSKITTLSSVAGLLAQTLRACDCDPVPLFARAGIDLGVSTDPNARIPTTRMVTLWRLAIEATGNPCLGLVAARQFQPAVLHGLGFAWLASDTLQDALSRLVRYSRFINESIDFQLEDNTDTLDLVIDVPETLLNGVYAGADSGLAIFLRMCQMTVGQPILPVRVTMQRPTPPCIEEFEAVFGPAIEYGAPAYRLCFDREVVTTPLTTAQPELARLNDQTVVDYLARFDRANITMQVRSKIIEQLHDGAPKQEDIAGTLHVSLRSLQRKLKDEHTSYKALLENTRQQLAMQYLRESQRSIGEITYLLGFAEPSNFTRAFRRWTGQSPGEFRMS